MLLENINRPSYKKRLGLKANIKCFIRRLNEEVQSRYLRFSSFTRFSQFRLIIDKIRIGLVHGAIHFLESRTPWDFCCLQVLLLNWNFERLFEDLIFPQADRLIPFLVIHNADIQTAVLNALESQKHFAVESEAAEKDYMRFLIENLFPFILPPKFLKCR